MQNTEVIILIGGGAIGLLAGMRLAEAGFRVSIVDQGHIGQEASWAGGGILSPLYPWRYPPELLRLAFYSMSLHQKLSEDLSSKTGIDPEWEPSGLRILQGEEAFPAGLIEWSQHWNLHWELAMADDALGPSIWCPEVAQVRNPRLLSALAERCRQLQINIFEETKITGFRQQNGQLTGMESNRGFIPASRAIVTAGAWTGNLLKSIGIHLDIYPVRGQMLLLQARPGRLSTMLMRDNYYLVPRRDGLILAGSTTEQVDFDKSVTREARDTLWDFAHACLPELQATHIIRQWSGLRPGSQDSIPYIGPLPAWTGLYVAAGHFRYGLTNAPATAEILVSLLTGTPPPLDIHPYLPDHPHDPSKVFP